MPRPQAVRVTEIAEILGVSHQRASKIVDERGFPRPIGRQGQSLALGPARGRGMGEGLAA
jgi:hypothetical protein